MVRSIRLSAEYVRHAQQSREPIPMGTRLGSMMTWPLIEHHRGRSRGSVACFQREDPAQPLLLILYQGRIYLLYQVSHRI